MVRDAVLLAAGRGSRLRELTEDAPKCMVKVGGRTLCQRAVESLEKLGVRRLHVVTGYLRSTLEEHIRSVANTLEVNFIHSHEWEITNNIVSLWKVGSAVSGDFVLLESDLLWRDEALNVTGGSTTATVSPLEKWMDGTTVAVDQYSWISSMFVTSPPPPSAILYKTVNIYGISIADWRNVIWPRLDRAVQEGRTRIYYETVFSEAIGAGEIRMKANVVPGTSWREIDTPEDLRSAEHWLASIE